MSAPRYCILGWCKQTGIDLGSKPYPMPSFTPCDGSSGIGERRPLRDIRSSFSA